MEMSMEADVEEFIQYLNNLTEAQFVEAMLGPKHLPLHIVIPLTIIYVMIFVTGVIGNIATCMVIIRNPTMQTATNYYLFSLAISDLMLLLLGLPNELNLFWEQYPWALGLGLCKIRAYVSEMSSYVSVLTIVAFSLERYLAICHPLHLHAMSGLKRPTRFIVAAWLIAIVCAIPFAVYTTLNYVEYPLNSGNYSKDSAHCALTLENLPDFPLYEFSGLVFFLIPMVIILVLYARMGLEIYRSTRNSLGRTDVQVHGDARQVQSRKVVIRMLSTVVVMFFICWAPFHGQRLLYVHGQRWELYPDINEWMYILGGCLYYFSTTVNPILYNIMSAKYRGAFKEMLCCYADGTIPRSRDTSSFRETTVCTSDSKDGTQLSLVRSINGNQESMRRSINQAKEILRGGSARVAKDPKEKEKAEVNENGARKPLLDVESRCTDGSYKNPVTVTNSTASSEF